MSRVTCHVSRVTCHLALVIFFIFCFLFYFFFSQNFLDKVVELVGGGGVINGAYPVYFITGTPISSPLQPLVDLASFCNTRQF